MRHLTPIGLTGGMESKRRLSNLLVLLICVLPPLCRSLDLVNPIKSEKCQFVDIGFLVDTSGSIVDQQSTWRLMQTFVNRLISRLDIGSDRDRVGMVKFSSTAAVVFNLSTWDLYSEYYQAVTDTQPLDENTYTALGLRTLRTQIFNTSNGDRPGYPNVAIVITDGRSNIQTSEIPAEAQALKDANIRVLVVGVTNDVYQDELNMIASSPSDVITIATYDQLLNFIDPLVGGACIPDVGPSDCQRVSDIALILDESSSIVYADSEHWYRDVLGFANSFFRVFNVSATTTRVGAVRFSDNAFLIFNFTAYSSTATLLPAFRRLIIAGGQTNTAEGFRVTRQQLFEVTPVRPNTNRIAILVTDGVPNDDFSANRAVAEAKLLKAEGIEVFVVGAAISADTDMAYLSNLASTPNTTHVFFVDDYTQLQDIVKNTSGLVCNATGEPTTTSTTTTTPTPPSTTTSTTTTTTRTSSTVQTTSTRRTTPTLSTPTSTVSTTSTSTSRTTAPSPGTTSTISQGQPTQETGSTSPTGPTPPGPGSTSPPGPIPPGTGSTSPPSPTPPGTGSTSPTGPTPPGPGSTSPTGPTPPETGSTSPTGPTTPGTGSTSPTGTTPPVTGSTSPTGPTSPGPGSTSPTGPTPPETGSTSPTGPTPSGTGSTSPTGPTPPGPGSTSPPGPTLPETSSTSPIGSAPPGTGSTSPTGPTPPGTGSTSPTGPTPPGPGSTSPTGPIPPGTGSTSPPSPTPPGTGSTSPTGPTPPGPGSTSPTGPTPPETGSTSPTGPTTPGTGSTSPTGPTPPGPGSTSPPGPTPPGTGSTSPPSPTPPGTGSTSPTGPTPPGTGSTSPTGPTPPGPASTSTTGPTPPETGSTSPTGPTPPGTGSTSPTGPTPPGTGSTSPTGPTPPGPGSTSPPGPTPPGTGSTSPTGPTPPGTGSTSPTGPTPPGTGSTSPTGATPPGPGSTSPPGPQTPVSTGSSTPIGSSPSATSAVFAGSTISYPYTPCHGDIDVVIVLDASGTYSPTTFSLIQNYLVSVVSKLDVENGLVRVGLVWYSDTCLIQIPLGSLTSRGQIIQVIQGLVYQGRRTDTAAALLLVATNGFSNSRPSAMKVVVLISNGNSASETQTVIAAERIKSSGILLLTLSVGPWRNFYAMTKIASYPYWKNMLVIDDNSLLNSAVGNLSDILCNNVQPCSQQKCQNSGNCTNYVTYYICICTPNWTGSDCTYRACAGSADIVFALDASGSIGDDNFRKETQFVTNVIASLDIASPSNPNGVRIGLLTFSDNVSIQFQLNNFTDKRQLLEAVNAPYTRGSTNTAYAIQAARQQMFLSSSGDRPSITNILVVLTDGLSNDPNQTWQEAMITRHANITILTIGVGSEYNINELRAIASDPLSSNVLTTLDFTTLANDTTQKLRDALCNDGNYCNSNPCQNGGMCRNILGGYVCDCPENATGILCERRGTGIIDLMFVLDGSGSIKSDRFSKVKQLAIAIVEQLEIRIDRTRVGVIYYSDYAIFAFNLIKYTVRQDLAEAINRISFIGNRTNTADALHMLWSVAFTEQNGDRPNVRNIAIVITDGASNINPEMTVVEAITVRQHRIRVITGTLGDFVNMVEIKMIASRPLDKNIFVALSYNDTERMKLAQQLINSTVDDYDECISSPCVNGGSCSNEYYSFVCSCTSFYAGYNCGWYCPNRFDVIMVLDLSGSVQTEYELVIELARAVVMRLDIDHDNSRFGVITYSTNVSSITYLSTYIQQKRSLLEALDFYHEGGYTNTQAALNALRTQLLDPSRGYRSPPVPTRGVLVSDGFSNIFHEQTIPEANATKALGVLMYSVVINVEHDLTEMEEVSSNPIKYVYTLLNSTYIETVANNLVRDLCQP